MVKVFNKMKKSIRRWMREPVFNTVNALVLFIFFAAVSYPIIYIVSASISSPEAVQRGAVWLFPVEMSLVAYKEVFAYSDIWMGYANSMFYMVVGTTISVCVTVTAAFALARKELPFRKQLMFLFTFTLLFGGGIIPLFLVTKATIGVNNRLSMIFPSALLIWNLIIARTNLMNSIPEELFEAAKIEGSDTFKYFIHIVVPLSKPIIAVLVMLYALANWNSYFYAFIFLQNRDLFPLQIILREILITNSEMELTGNVEAYANVEAMKQLLKYAVIVVASLPVLVLYPFVQKYFVKSIMVGAVKG